MKKTFGFLLLLIISQFLLTGLDLAVCSAQVNACSLPAPAGLQSTLIEPTGFGITYSGVSGATAYRIHVASVLAPATDNTTIYSLGTTAWIGNRQPGTTYTVEVRAVCSNGLFGAPAYKDITTTQIIINDVYVDLSGAPSTSSQGPGTISVAYVCLPIPSTTSQLAVSELRTKFTWTSSENTEVNATVSTSIVAGNTKIWVGDKDFTDASNIRLIETSQHSAAVKLQYMVRPGTWVDKVVWGGGVLGYNSANVYSASCRMALFDCALTAEYNGEYYSESDNECIVINNQRDNSEAVGLLELESPVISPNPFTDHLLVRPALQQAGPVSMHLFNSLGQRVRSLQLDAATPEEARELQFDTANLPAGTYFLRLNANDHQKTYTVVKQ